MFVDEVKLFIAEQNWSTRHGGCSVIDCYSDSYQEEAKFMFW